MDVECKFEPSEADAAVRWLDDGGVLFQDSVLIREQPWAL
jgi:hypothetical protein